MSEEQSNEPEKVTDHREVITGIAMVCRALEVYDIEGAIKRARHALDFGCYFQPTAWMQNADKLKEDVQILEAAMPLVNLMAKMRQRAQESRVRPLSEAR